jgi:hypothetical protein
MADHSRVTITDAELLGVCNGLNEATGLPVVCLTLRPITGSGWGHVNYALSIENARSLLDRLTTAFATSSCLVDGGSGTTA